MLILFLDLNEALIDVSVRDIWTVEGSNLPKGTHEVLLRTSEISVTEIDVKSTSYRGSRLNHAILQCMSNTPSSYTHCCFSQESLDSLENLLKNMLGFFFVANILVFDTFCVIFVIKETSTHIY